MKLLSMVIVLALFAVTVWADDLSPDQIKALAAYQQKVDEANGIAPPATQPATTQPTVGQLMAMIQTMNDTIEQLKIENARLRATTKPSDASVPQYAPPVGTAEVAVVLKWLGKPQGDGYVLPNGAIIKCQNGKVFDGYLLPTLGMDQAAFVGYNYGNYQGENKKEERIYTYKPLASSLKLPHVTSVVVSLKTKKITSIER